MHIVTKGKLNMMETCSPHFLLIKLLNLVETKFDACMRNKHLEMLENTMVALEWKC
jgi:hypothetical protein